MSNANTENDISAVKKCTLQIISNVKICNRLHLNLIANAQVPFKAKHESHILRYSSSVGGSTPKSYDIWLLRLKHKCQFEGKVTNLYWTTTGLRRRFCYGFMVTNDHLLAMPFKTLFYRYSAVVCLLIEIGHVRCKRSVSYCTE